MEITKIGCTETEPDNLLQFAPSVVSAKLFLNNSIVIPGKLAIVGHPETRAIKCSWIAVFAVVTKGRRRVIR